jgi:hypothetical protein
MTRESLTFEFHSEIPDLDSTLEQGAAQRLGELATAHSGMLGASISVEKLASVKEPYVFQARAVAYMGSYDVAAVEKAETADEAVRGALVRLERHISEYSASGSAGPEQT